MSAHIDTNSTRFARKQQLAIAIAGLLFVAGCATDGHYGSICKKRGLSTGDAAYQKCIDQEVQRENAHFKRGGSR